MRRAFKYRLDPNASQESDLETMRETHRRLYNACLLRFTLGLRTDPICEAKDSRPEAQKNVQPERESQ